MKNIIAILCFLLVSSAFAQTDIVGSLTNRKTNEKLLVGVNHQSRELSFSLVKFGQEQIINKVRYAKLSDLNGINIKGSHYNMKILKTGTSTSGKIFSSLGRTVSDIVEWCTEGYDAEPFVCFFPVPGIAVAIPAVSVGMGTAGAVTFLASVLATPVDGAITLISSLTSKGANAKRKFSKAMKGKNVKMSDRSFNYLLDEVLKL